MHTHTHAHPHPFIKLCSRYNKTLPLGDHHKLQCWIIGQVLLPVPHLQNLNHLLSQRFQKFVRVLVCTTLLNSTECTRVKCRNSYTICYKARATGTLIPYPFALISTFRVASELRTVIQIWNVLPVLPTGEYEVIDINSIVRNSVSVSLSSQSYICIPPNNVTYD